MAKPRKDLEGAKKPELLADEHTVTAVISGNGKETYYIKDFKIESSGRSYQIVCVKECPIELQGLFTDMYKAKKAIQAFLGKVDEENNPNHGNPKL